MTTHKMHAVTRPLLTGIRDIPYQHLLLLTVISLVTLSLFFWVPSFGIEELYHREPYDFHTASLIGTSSHHVERIGVLGPGSEWVCGMECIAEQARRAIYSSDINGESSFKAALLERPPGCEFGPEIEDSPNLKERAHFFQWAPGSPERHAFIDVLKVNVVGTEFDMLVVFLAAHKLLSPFSSMTFPIGQL
ncbi:hypothetical protein H4582DRAFT_2099256 [Lactarius indigo]|nr:hypothetical protein H4582DRAFT_2099256 [Lactarius indigo]